MNVPFSFPREPSSFLLARCLIVVWFLLGGAGCLFLLGCSNPKESSAIKTLGSHSHPVCTVAFSPDGKILASGGGGILENGIVKIWNLETGVERTLPQEPFGYGSLLFSPDGKTLAAGTREGAIILWETATWNKRLVLESGPGYSVFAFAPDGKTLASVGPDDRLFLWDPATGQCQQTLKHPWAVSNLAFSPDGKTLAMDGGERTIKLWDVATNRERGSIHVPEFEGTGSIRGLAFTPDSRLLATGGYDAAVRLWDVATAKEVARVETWAIRGLRISPNGKWLVTWGKALGNDPNGVSLWDLQSGKLLSQLQEHTSTISGIAFSPDSNTLATGSENGLVQLWDVRKLLSQPKQ
jgi:WD40 repeat protein